MTKGLIIYDNNGTVVAILRGVEVVPSGVQGVIDDIPNNIATVQVNPQTKEVTYTYLPITEEEVTSLQNAMADHEARLLALEG